MMIDVNSLLPILLYLCLIVLVVVFIILGIKLIRVLDKTDEMLDEVNKKIKSVDGVFNIIDRTTGVVNTISDRIIDRIAGFVGHVFRRKRGYDEDE